MNEASEGRSVALLNLSKRYSGVIPGGFSGGQMPAPALRYRCSPQTVLSPPGKKPLAGEIHSHDRINFHDVTAGAGPSLTFVIGRIKPDRLRVHCKAYR